MDLGNELLTIITKNLDMSRYSVSFSELSGPMGNISIGIVTHYGLSVWFTRDRGYIECVLGNPRIPFSYFISIEKALQHVCGNSFQYPNEPHEYVSSVCNDIKLYEYKIRQLADKKAYMICYEGNH